MFKNLHLKSLLLLAVMLIGGGSFALAETKTYKHVLTANELNAIGQTSATLSDNNGNIAGGVLWTVTPTWGTKPNAQNVDGTKGQQYGSKNNAASLLVFSTSHDFGTITAVKVNASTASSATATIAVKVGSTDFTRSGNTSASLSSTATDYEFTGSASGTITITLSQPTTTKALYVKSFEVTYEVGAPVSVTGISLDQSTANVEVGGTVTLTPTITPANASNKNVTWESDKEDVATVSNDGVVTGVAAGTATITATTNNGFTATCDVTVKAPATPTLTLDFTDNTDWGFPEDTKEVGTHDYANGVTITLYGPSGNGYYFDTNANNLLMGKNGASLTLPVFSFNVSKIKVYGADSASKSVTFNIFVGDEAVSTQATSAKVTHTFNIAADKQASGNVYVLKVTNDQNIRISKIEVFGYEPVTITDAGMATFCSTENLDFTDVKEIDVYKATVVEKTINFTRIEKVPANTGVLLRNSTGAKAAVAVNVPVLSGDVAAVTGNLFVAATDEITSLASISTDGSKNYILNDGANGLGFYLANGHKVGAGKAYLNVPEGAAKGFITFDDATGIELVNTANEVAAPVYNLQGQRVSEGYKGVVIVNGKKIMMK